MFAAGDLSVAAVPEPLARPGHVLIANACSIVSAGTEKDGHGTWPKIACWARPASGPTMFAAFCKNSATRASSTRSAGAGKARRTDDHGLLLRRHVLACGAGVQTVQARRSRCLQRSSCRRRLRAQKSLRPSPRCASLSTGRLHRAGGDRACKACGWPGWDWATPLSCRPGPGRAVAVALLRANGCRVLGTDPDPAKCRLALQMGAEQAEADSPPEQCLGPDAHGLGADAVLITASTKSDGPVELAGEAVRQKGRVVAVGAVGPAICRAGRITSRRPSSSSPAPTGRGATIANTRSAATIIPPHTSAGPSSATCRPCSI